MMQGEGRRAEGGESWVGCSQLTIDNINGLGVLYYGEGNKKRAHKHYAGFTI